MKRAPVIRQAFPGKMNCNVRFLELLEQMRASQIKTPEFTPTQDPSRKGISIEEIQEIGEKGKTTATEVKTPDAQVTEIETEEPKGKPSIL